MIIIAGKMHAAGSVSEAGSAIIDDETIAAFVGAGADVVLLPAPGTVPGCHEAQVRGWVEAAHRAGALTMTAIGTSQEGADVDTIRALALMAKMTGTDIHHLGDCGYYGITLPENLVDLQHGDPRAPPHLPPDGDVAAALTPPRAAPRCWWRCSDFLAHLRRVSTTRVR